MFIRKKKNPSGVVSVQIIDKSRNSYKVFKTVGSSSDPAEIDKLFEQGQKWLATHCGNRDMFQEADRQREEKQFTEYSKEHLKCDPCSILLKSGYKRTFAFVL